jgi:hypothetical protein
MEPEIFYSYAFEQCGIIGGAKWKNLGRFSFCVDAKLKSKEARSIGVLTTTNVYI